MPNEKGGMKWSEKISLFLAILTLAVAYQTCNLGANVEEQKKEFTQLVHMDSSLLKMDSILIDLNNREYTLDTINSAELGIAVNSYLRAGRDSIALDSIDAYKYLDFVSALGEFALSLPKNYAINVKTYNRDFHLYNPLFLDTVRKINRLFYEMLFVSK